MKIKTGQTDGKELHEYCHVCKRKQRHLVLSSVQASGYEDWGDDGGIHFGESAEVIQCQGCENFSFKSTSWNSENYDPETGKVDENTELYPKRSEKTLSPKPFLNIPDNTNEIYRESIDAFNHNQKILCSAGIRAIVESVCIDKGVKKGSVIVGTGPTQKTIHKTTLEGKLNGMLAKGILTKDLVESLHETRLIGNEAVHQLKRIKSEELETALSIVETIMDAIYEVPIKTSRLRNRK